MSQTPGYTHGHLRLIRVDEGDAAGRRYEVHCCFSDPRGVVVNTPGIEVDRAGRPRTKGPTLRVFFPKKSGQADQGALVDQDDPRYARLCASGS